MAPKLAAISWKKWKFDEDFNIQLHNTSNNQYLISGTHFNCSSCFFSSNCWQNCNGMVVKLIHSVRGVYSMVRL